MIKGLSPHQSIDHSCECSYFTLFLNVYIIIYKAVYFFNLFNCCFELSSNYQLQEKGAQLDDQKVFLHTNPLTLVVSVNIFVVFLIFSFSLHVHFCLKRHLCLSLDATTAFLVADALKFWILRVKQHQQCKMFMLTDQLMMTERSFSTPIH